MIPTLILLKISGTINRPNRHYEQSDYGNDRVAWGRTATESWTFDRDRAGYAGQFIWTGFDYIGEPTPWHNQDNTPVKSSYFGIIDTAGLPKNDFYLYRSEWYSAKEKPTVRIMPHWNWTEETLKERNMLVNGKVPVRTFSNAASVELFLNNESLGKKELLRKQLKMVALITRELNQVNCILSGWWTINQVP